MLGFKGLWVCLGGEEVRCRLAGWVEADRAISKLAHPEPQPQAMNCSSGVNSCEDVQYE